MSTRDEERRSVAANAAAGALFGVLGGQRVLDANEVEAAAVVGGRVVDHLDRWDADHADRFDDELCDAPTPSDQPGARWAHLWGEPDDVGEVNIANFALLGTNGDTFAPSLPSMGPWTRDEALVFAGWLVTMADPLGRRFPGILERIHGT